MDKNQLAKELLAEKDPETLLRKVHVLDPKIISALFSTSKNDELLGYVARTIRDNPEIRNKIRDNAEEMKREEN
jgi:hypothetical protein